MQFEGMLFLASQSRVRNDRTREKMQRIDVTPSVL